MGPSRGDIIGGLKGESAFDICKRNHSEQDKEEVGLENAAYVKNE